MHMAMATVTLRLAGISSGCCKPHCCAICMAWVKLVGLVSQREFPEMHREFVCVFFNLADWELPPPPNGIHRKYETSKSLVDGLQFYTQEMLKVRAHTHSQVRQEARSRSFEPPLQVSRLRRTSKRDVVIARLPRKMWRQVWFSQHDYYSEVKQSWHLHNYMILQASRAHNHGFKLQHLRNPSKADICQVQWWICGHAAPENDRCPTIFILFSFYSNFIHFQNYLRYTHISCIYIYI